MLTAAVQPSTDTSCFLSDQTIHGLYTFAFNMSNSYNGDNHFPPQCSNLSMSWPTSLESPILDVRELGGQAKAMYTDALPPPPARFKKRAPQVPNPTSTVDGDTSSSNKTSGNTTVPPTMFGIIPLGNSFSIPITYPRNSKFASTLPPESLSDHPTTWTSKGVTHMNLTVSLAKGTRFIIVAGIGSQEQWASGGSSEMLTVGQGSFDCLNHGDGTIPTITATSTSGRITRPTASPSQGVGVGKKQDGMNWKNILLACVFTVLGTLVLVTLLFCCCRVRKQRKKARQAGAPAPGILAVASYGKLGKNYPSGAKRYNGHGSYSTDLQLDLIGARDRDDASDSPSSRSGRPPLSRPGTDYVVDSPTYRDSPLRASGYSQTTFTSRSPTDDAPHPFYAQQRTSSPVTTGDERTYSGDNSRQSSDLIGRNTSLDGTHSQPPPQSRRLQLHDPSQLEERRGSDDITDLKRETLALLHQPGAAPPSPRSRSGPSRRRTEDTYVIHQDGGRVAMAPQPGRVLELPPRYEELNWEEADTDSALPARGASIPLPPSPTSYPNSPISRGGSIPPFDLAAFESFDRVSLDSRTPSIQPPSLPPSLRSPSTAPSIPPGAEEPHPPGSSRGRDRAHDRDRKS